MKNRFEVIDGAKLSLAEIVKGQAGGKPVRRSAHLGSLNSHTMGVALAGVPVVLHEHIDANDGGYPASKVQINGSEITISDGGEIDGLYAPFREGRFRVDVSPANFAILDQTISEALRSRSVLLSLAGLARPLSQVGREVGVVSYTGEASQLLSPKILTLLGKATSPSQLHYAALQEAMVGSSGKVETAAEALLAEPASCFDILRKFQGEYPQAFGEYVTNTGQRLKIKSVTRDEVEYSNGSVVVQVPRRNLAKDCFDFLEWQRQAVLDMGRDYLKAPKEGPVLSGLAYAVMMSCVDMLQQTHVLAEADNGRKIIRHVGGNEMHRYMLYGDESASSQREVEALYRVAYRAMRDKLPAFVSMELVPGKELSPFVYTGLTEQIVKSLLDNYRAWQDQNLLRRDLTKDIRQELMDSAGAVHVDDLTKEGVVVLLEAFRDNHQDLYTQLQKKLSTSTNLREIFERLAKVAVESQTKKLDVVSSQIDRDVAVVVNSHPLGRFILGKPAGITLSQYDVLEHGGGVPEIAKNIPFEELSGVVNWVRKRAEA